MLTPPAQDHARLHATAAEDALHAAIRALRAHGLRITNPRRAVLEALAARPDQLTAEEVTSLVEPAEVHRATVYRTLDVLVQAGVVSQQHTPGGMLRYHLLATGSGGEHLHGQCHVCSTVVALPADVFDEAESVVLRDTGFRLEVLHTTFTGVCAGCA